MNTMAIRPVLGDTSDNLGNDRDALSHVLQRARRTFSIMLGPRALLRALTIEGGLARRSASLMLNVAFFFSSEDPPRARRDPYMGPSATRDHQRHGLCGKDRRQAPQWLKVHIGLRSRPRWFPPCRADANPAFDSDVRAVPCKWVHERPPQRLTRKITRY